MASVAHLSIKVRLITDLTRYHPSLVVGTEGLAIGAYDIWSRNFDRFTGVCFPQTTLDVLWSGLEIIDEDFLRARGEERSAMLDAARLAHSVVQHAGPRGAFHRLGYHVPLEDGRCRHEMVWDRETADELRELFQQHGITVREQRGSDVADVDDCPNAPAPRVEPEPAPPAEPAPVQLQRYGGAQPVTLPANYPVAAPRSSMRPGTVSRLLTAEAWIEHLVKVWSEEPPTDAVAAATLDAFVQHLRYVRIPGLPNLRRLGHLVEEHLLAPADLPSDLCEALPSIRRARQAHEQRRDPPAWEYPPLPEVDDCQPPLVGTLSVDGRRRAELRPGRELVLRLRQPGEDTEVELRIELEDGRAVFDFGPVGGPRSQVRQDLMPPMHSYEFRIKDSGREAVQPLIEFLVEQGWQRHPDATLTQTGTPREVFGALRALYAWPSENPLEHAWVLQSYLELRTTALASNGVVYALDVLKDLQQKWGLMERGTRSDVNYTVIDGRR